MKTFTLDEAQSLLPVLESLLKRAIEGKTIAEEKEAKLHELRQRIFLSGGMHVNVIAVARQRAEIDKFVQQAKDAVAEIDSIGVQVKDLETGLLDFPCMVNSEIVVPIFARKKLAAELDVESYFAGTFTEAEKEFVEACARVVGNCLDKT